MESNIIFFLHSCNIYCGMFYEKSDVVVQDPQMGSTALTVVNVSDLTLYS